MSCSFFFNHASKQVPNEVVLYASGKCTAGKLCFSHDCFRNINCLKIYNKIQMTGNTAGN